MKGLRDERGFTMVDILVALALVGIVTAMAVPMADSTSRGFRIRGDAQAIANMVTLAKMRAASRFSRTRIRADLGANSYRLEIWDKAAAGGAGAWAIDGGDIRLSRGVTFGFAALGTPPPNTQAAIGQSPACTSAASLTGDLVAGTACIVFNSRGVPVDNTLAGAPVGGNALYITDRSGVYATTVTATPLVRQWWSNVSVPTWVHR
jgi:type II secretory pathway pseudopilin PulG